MNSICVRNATFPRGSEGGKDFTTIIQVCNQLSHDGFIQRKHILSRDCKYSICESNVVIHTKKWNNLSANETAVLIAEELIECFMDVRVIDDTIYIKFDENGSERKYSDLIKNSINKIIRY